MPETSEHLEFIGTCLKCNDEFTVTEKIFANGCPACGYKLFKLRPLKSKTIDPKKEKIDPQTSANLKNNLKNVDPNATIMILPDGTYKINLSKLVMQSDDPIIVYYKGQYKIYMPGTKLE